jgi:hypothetical protein
MIKIAIGTRVFKYLAYGSRVGIITPSRQKHIVQLSEVTGYVIPGSSAITVSPEQVATYILKAGLK